MQIIEHTGIGGERPLFASSSICLRDVTVHDGESALKCSTDVHAENCRINGMYAFWECNGVKCSDTVFAPEARACSWYGSNHAYSRCTIDAPKMFRELDGITLEDSIVTDGAETFWRCRNGHLSDVKLMQSEYCFLNAERFVIRRMSMQGKYAFQYARNIEIHDSVLDTKDAFWESDGCLVCDTEIKGEYLGWYSRNLHLVRCHISGTQPLCYCKDLVLEDCTFADDCDRCFEKSHISGSIIGSVPSITEPVFGNIEYK